MDKYKIVALFGEAGAGKDYIQKSIIKTDWGKKYLHEIISNTTRPPRENEIDGIHYHFFPSSNTFIKKDLIEYTIFRNWWYGTSIDSLDINKINVGVFNISGIEQLIYRDFEHRIDCLPIKVVVSEKIRLIRQLERETNPNCDEIIRRFTADKKDFLNIPFEYKIIENNTNEIIPVLEDIKSYIKTKWSIEEKIS